MGNKSSTNNNLMGSSHEDDQQEQSSNWGASMPFNHSKDGDISKCPVMGGMSSSGKRRGNTGANPLTALLEKKGDEKQVEQSTPKEASESVSASAAVEKDQQGEKKKSRKMRSPYDPELDDEPFSEVYAQQGINPLNNMPISPSQQPHPDQRKSLPLDRQPSTIPRANNKNTWLYPSEQMFYNALKRKNKYDSDITEDDIKSIVAIHNGMNEKTWRELLRWEECIHNECPTPTLLQFVGRPEDLSPKAFLKHHLLRYPMPFDRHDWVIDRCGKQRQRYVIDFYYKENIDKEADMKNGFIESRRILIDVRPALDDWRSAYDRVRFFFTERYNRILGRNPPQ